MDVFYNKLYIRIDDINNIIRGFSDAFEQPLGSDICINEQGGRHFELPILPGQPNPPLQNEDGIHLYRYENHMVIVKTKEELEAERRKTVFDTAAELKLEEMNTACQNAITAGVEIETSQGVKHFSLTEHDQMEITNLSMQLERAVLGQPSKIDLNQGIPYHADGELCRFWSAEDFTAIAQRSMEHIFYHRTYCNHLRRHVKGIEDYDELQLATYGMELPPELAASMMALLGQGVQDG